MGFAPCALSNRLTLILSCVLFNILFEYSGRGITALTRIPSLFPILAGLYLSYFAMFEDLMVRYRLNNLQVVLLGMMYGNLAEAFLTGNLFNRTINWAVIVAGVNVGSLILIVLCAWGVMQAVITLYFANRITKRDWGHPRMGAFGWGASILFQLVMFILASRSPITPHGTETGYLFLFAIEVGLLALFLFTLMRSKREKTSAFVALPIMDILIVVSVALFLVLGTLFSFGTTVVTSHVLNRGPAVVEIMWTGFAAAVFILYRISRRKEIIV